MSVLKPASEAVTAGVVRPRVSVNDDVAKPGFPFAIRLRQVRLLNEAFAKKTGDQNEAHGRRLSRLECSRILAQVSIVSRRERLPDISRKLAMSE